MASELRVDTLKDSSGSNSVGMSYVAGGSAKAFANFDGNTASLRGSFNVSSLDDDGLGLFGVNLTSSMSDGNYNLSGGTGSGDTNVHHIHFAASNLSPTTPSTSAYPVKTANAGGAGLLDSLYTMSEAHGDLA